MPTPTSIQTARDQWERYTYMRDTGHLQYVDKAIKCEAFFAGCQWATEDAARLRDQRRPGLTINKVLGTLSNIMGEQIDLRTEIAYQATYGAPSGNADTLTKLFRYISDRNMLNTVRSSVFADGAITSRGFFDVRMNYDRSLTGDIRIVRWNPKNVIVDPDGEEYDPDTWNDVILTRWMTPDDIEFMYNAADAKVLAQRVDSSWEYGYDSMDRGRDRFAGPSAFGGQFITSTTKNVQRMIRVVERQYRQLTKMKYFVNMKNGDRREIPHTWERNKIAAALEPYKGMITVDEHIGKRIRFTTTAEDIELHNEWSPYQHFTVIPYFPYFRNGNTIGLVENLIDPQELLNKAVSSELHAITTMANSGWKIKKGSLKNYTPDELEEYGARSGIVLELDSPDDAEKIQPNQIPQGLSDLARKGESYIKTVSGRGDAQTGMARADVSADQIEAQARASDKGLRPAMENLLYTDKLMARNILALVQEFYTDPRIMKITNSELTGEQEEISINWPDPETGELMNDVSLGEYTFTVIAQPAKQTLEMGQFEQASYMREKLGIKIPDQFMIENSQLLNKTELVKALNEQANSPTAQLEQKVQLLGGQLEIANMKAEAARVESDAVLKRAKAAETVAKTEELTRGDPTAQAEMELKRQEAELDMQLEQQKHDQKMQMQREEHEMEMSLRVQEAEEEHRLKRAQAIATMRQVEQQQNQPAGGKPAAGASK